MIAALRNALLLVLMLLSAESVWAEWGRGATLTPGWERIQQSALRALQHPMTWGPAIAGLAVHLSGNDDEWAESLYEDAPLFGDPNQANHESDRYRQAADILWVVSMAATDSGKEDPWGNKARGILVQAAAGQIALTTSNILKETVQREEPLPSGECGSFTSNHAVQPFAQAALIRENMRSSNTRLPRPLAHTMVAAGYIAASGSAWGRIEAGAHHLSDQLAGAAIGNFIAMFINDAFLGEASQLTVSYAAPDAVMLSLLVPF